MLLKIVGERLAHGLVHRAGYFRITQTRLGLAFKLRFGHFNRDYGGQSFAEVFAGNLYFCLFYLFGSRLFGIFLQDTSDGLAETD